MRVVLQRSKQASVSVNKKIVGEINNGLVILVGFTKGDTKEEIDYLANKIINLRIFDDDNSIMNKSLLDINGEVLSISQFTLYADTKSGRRPSYIKALNGNEAIKLYDEFNKCLKEKGIKVATGIFGSDMQVSLINDGPVTITLEKENENGKK